MKPNLSVEKIAGALAVLGTSVMMAACGGDKPANTPVNATETSSSGDAKPADGHCGAGKEHKPGDASCGAKGGAASCGAGKGGAASCGAGKTDATTAPASGTTPAATPTTTDTKSTTSTTTTPASTTTTDTKSTTKKATTPAPASTAKKGGGASCGAGTCGAKK